MTGNEYASLIYLGLLGLVLGGMFLLRNRRRLGTVAQQAAIWALIFVGAIAAAGLWDDIRSTVPNQQAVFSESGEITVPRGPDGHYYLTLEVDDTPVRFLVDTGASDMVLSLEDARRIGIDTDTLRFFGQASTANGVVKTALVRLDSVAVGPVTDRGVNAAISGGKMPGSLLGMGYLSRFSAMRFEDDHLTLVR